MTIADRLALARAASALPIAALLLAGLPLAAAALLACAALSDAADGWLARSRGETSARGAFLDQAADKVLVVVTLAALLARGAVPPWAFAATAARELLVVVLRATGGAGPSTRWARLKTALQFVALIAAASSLALPWLVTAAGALVAASVAASLLTGAVYLLRSGGAEGARAG